MQGERNQGCLPYMERSIGLTQEVQNRYNGNSAHGQTRNRMEDKSRFGPALPCKPGNQGKTRGPYDLAVCTTRQTCSRQSPKPSERGARSPCLDGPQRAVDAQHAEEAGVRFGHEGGGEGQQQGTQGGSHRGEGR